MKEKRKQKLFSKIEIFYSIKEERILIIPIYYTNGSSDLTTLINNLTDIEDVVSEITGKPNNKVYASEITRSRRYKGKWAFWFDYPKELPLPEKTFQLDSWNINEWLTY